jgi:hypothetical protein
MDVSHFAAMSPGWREACQAALGESVLILIHPGPHSAGKHGERAAIVCDGDALRGWLPLDGAPGKRTLAKLYRDIGRSLAATGPGQADELDEDNPE